MHLGVFFGYEGTSTKTRKKNAKKNGVSRATTSLTFTAKHLNWKKKVQKNDIATCRMSAGVIVAVLAISMAAIWCGREITVLSTFTRLHEKLSDNKEKHDHERHRMPYGER